MSYTTLANLTDRFGESMLISLTDRDDVSTGVVDVDVINRALADTDAVIDGYVAVKYALPMASIPPLLGDIAQTVAIWKLHIYAVDPKIEEDYKNALRSLRDISSGTIRLDIAGVAPAGTGGTGVRVTDRERPLTAANLKGFI